MDNMQRINNIASKFQGQIDAMHKEKINTLGGNSKKNSELDEELLKIDNKKRNLVESCKRETENGPYNLRIGLESIRNDFEYFLKYL